MALFKEPRAVDFSTKSSPWTEQELIDFRKIMNDLKRKKKKKKNPAK